MENKDFKDEQAIKYWLHYFRRNDIPELTAAELEEQSEYMYHALMQGHAAPAVKTKKLWFPSIAAAAALVLIIGGSLFYYKYSAPVEHAHLANVAVKDVAPGISAATLILGDGKGIALSKVKNGKVADQSGVSIIKTADNKLVYQSSGSKADRVQINTILTAKGEEYQVDLPDGTKVWLNAASSVKFPATFAELENRTVELTGEAYFEVAKDKLHPFIVKTAKQDIKVLGTHFNISSYADEKVTRTTLLEGAVKVCPKGDKSAIAILKPGQQAQLSASGLKIKAVDVSDSMAWKNGDFVFDNEDFASILKQISRWYNVEIVDEGKHDGVQLTGMVSRSKNLSTVLKSIEKTAKVKFRIEGKKVTVTD